MITAQPPAAFVEELTNGLRSALGLDLVAAYLYGSAVAGGFDEDVSDIDILVVTERDLDHEAVSRIDAFHARTIDGRPEWEGRLELVYVGRNTLAHFPDGGTLGVISPGEPFHIRDGIELWLQNFYLVRATGKTLVGPGAATSIPDISWMDFITATARYANDVRGRNLCNASPGQCSYGVLTMCRALCTIRSGKTCSKQEGAAWVRARMPEWAWLIGQAEQCRMSRGAVGFRDDETRQSAETLIALIGDAIAADLGRIAGA